MRLQLSFTAVLFASLASLSAQAPISQGNICVYRVGDGTAALAGVSTATFLDEFTPSGALVQSIAMPTAPSGSNLPFTNSGSATSEGFLNLSSNGQFLVVGGYATAPGIVNVATAASSLIQRSVARIDLNGVVDTSSTLGAAFNGNNIRSVASPDGVQFFCAGSNTGVQYSIYASNTTTQINSATPTNLRVANIFNGQLYVSSASGAFQGVSTMGTGLPTTSGQTATLLPGFPTATGPSNYDYFFADANTVYVADDRVNGSGGLQKWTLSAGLWTLQYTLAVSPTIGCRSVTGISSGGSVILFATTSTASANNLVSVVDVGAGSAFSTLAAAPTNTAFRGLRRIATPASVSFAGTGSPTTVGIPQIGTANGQPAIGNTSFQITAGNLGTFGIGFVALGISTLGAGFPVPGAPATVQLYLTPAQTSLVLGDLSGNASLNFPLPNVPAYIGFPIAAQIIAFDGNMPDPLPIGTSVGMQLIIGG